MMGRPVKHPPRESYPEGWIDTTEVALILRMSYQTARDGIFKGLCGPVKMIGRTRLVRRDNVMELKRQLDEDAARHASLTSSTTARKAR
jgi:hypothetical protein